MFVSHDNKGTVSPVSKCNHEIICNHDVLGSGISTVPQPHPPHHQPPPHAGGGTTGSFITNPSPSNDAIPQ
jgi:hypothetical protein